MNITHNVKWSSFRKLHAMKYKCMPAPVTLARRERAPEKCSERSRAERDADENARVARKKNEGKDSM